MDRRCARPEFTNEFSESAHRLRRRRATAMAKWTPATWMLLACAASNVAWTWTALAQGQDLKGCQVPLLEDIGSKPTSFYQCAESMMQCGEDGYLQRHASKYALKYQTQLKPLLSTEGKDFVDKFTFCLQYYLRSRAGERTTCGRLQSLVDEFAGTCYFTSGLCDVPLVDTLLWAKSVDWLDLPTMTFLETTHSLYYKCNWTNAS